ncbi:sodium-dependent transporter [bacterium]|nr:sodium-dependent transporter [bacterium]
MIRHQEKWGTRIGLILAMAGNAVGLGNFLRFPAQAAQNGGGAFIIPYLISFVLMGIPLLWVEWAIGRHGGLYGMHHVPGMMDCMGKSRALKYAGVFGIFTNLGIAAYYVYIESWTLGYVWYSVTGAFTGMTAEEVSRFFSMYLDTGSGGLINLNPISVIFLLLTLSLNIYILSRGVSKGIEKTCRIGMPLLILFGIFLTVRALTLKAGVSGASHDALIGLNFLWQPQPASLTNPKIWLAAAGQIFFTLSVGMGSVHVYSSYVKKNQDIALNAASAGWMNAFVEVVLGGSVVIPIAVAYLGLDWVQSNVGFEMAFRTLPSLFQNWGPLLAALGGLAWFGLLFFAGITSSLAMGQPVMSFLQVEFDMPRKKSALLFGLICLAMALPCVLFYGAGCFGEYDFWAGTFSLVAFALIEIIVFAWVFGMDKGWQEINRGADIKVPVFFRFVIKYITPLFLLAVFLGSMFKPENGDWAAAAARLAQGRSWNLAPDSVLGTVLNKGIADKRFLVDGRPTPLLFVTATRMFLLLIFTGIAVLVYKAWRNHKHPKEEI